jgi:hypothetical protein
MEIDKKTGPYNLELLDCSLVWSEKKLDWIIVMYIYLYFGILRRIIKIILYFTFNISSIALNNFYIFLNILIY